MKKLSLLHQGKKKPVSILSDEFCEEQAFAYLLPKVNLANALRDIPRSLAPNFNQRLLNFNEYLVSDVDHIFLARSVYEQRHLHSSINFTMNKI